MFERYSELARQAIFFALIEAREAQAAAIDTDHLLVGILVVDPELSAQFALEAHKSKFEQSFAAGPSKQDRTDLPVTSDLGEVMRHAVSALTIVVDRKGLPQNPRIVRCTYPIFAENSLNAVKRYRFVPATTIADNKAVLFNMHIEISYRFGPSPNPVALPRPRIKAGFLVGSQPAPSGPDRNGVYTLTRDFDPPNSFPQIQRFVNAGFGRAAFALEDGAGCVAALTIDETGHPTDAQITKCDDPSLENPVLRSLWKSQYSPAILNGKPVPVRTSVHLVCEGFGPTSGP